MGLDNDIEYAIKGILKNPILTVLREIKMVKLNMGSLVITERYTTATLTPL
jgi:hypothetical protein